MNISDFGLKVKLCVERGKTREVYVVLLIILVGFASFGLGRLSKLRGASLPVILEEASSESTVAAVMSAVNPPTGTVSGQVDLPASLNAAQGGKFVASKGGTKYHFPWCSGAKRITEANKIWFESVEEARKAGYTPASNCKGLK